MVRPQSMVCVLISSLIVLAAAGHAFAFDTLSASYLGGSGADAGNAMDVAPDHTLVYGGLAPGHNPGGVTPVDLLGGGDGLLVRLDRTGKSVLSATRVGNGISDLQIGDDGRIVVAAQGVGPVVLSSDGGSALWNKPLPNISRVSVGRSGTVAALVENGGSNYDLYVYDPAGNQIGYRHFGDRMVNDVAVDDTNGQVIVTGFNNKTYMGVPVQVPFNRAFTSDLATMNWKNYDWTGDQVGGSGDGTQNSSMADSRGYRVTMGRDDKLYFMGEAHGGNATFRYDPQVVDRFLASDEWIKFDHWNNPWGTRSEAKTVFSRVNPADGTLDMIEWIFARTDSLDGNTLRGRAIAADEAGRVYLSGMTTGTIKNRDANDIDGEMVGPYSSSEMFLAVIAPDFQSRDVWTPFTDANTGSMDGYGYGIGVRDGLAGVAGAIRDSTGEHITSGDALQAIRDADEEGYFVAWNPWEVGDLNGDNAVTFSEAAAVVANLGLTGAKWIDGDWDMNGVVELPEAQAAVDAYSLASPNGVQLTIIPEPVAADMLLIGIAGLIRRRR